MAKGQIRGSREARKPKKDKSAAAPASQQGSQVKQAASTTSLGKELATGLLPVIEGKESAAGHDSSTQGLVAELAKLAK